MYLRFDVEQVNGKTFQVVLQDLKYVPELWVNVFQHTQSPQEWF
jgi:hypothetical protein